jgi:hypothetical protein
MEKNEIIKLLLVTREAMYTIDSKTAEIESISPSAKDCLDTAYKELYKAIELIQEENNIKYSEWGSKLLW